MMNRVLDRYFSILGSVLRIRFEPKAFRTAMQATYRALDSESAEKAKELLKVAKSLSNDLDPEIIRAEGMIEWALGDETIPPG